MATIGADIPGGLSKQSTPMLNQWPGCVSKCLIFILDPIAWIPMTLLLGIFIGFAVLSIYVRMLVVKDDFLILLILFIQAATLKFSLLL